MNMKTTTKARIKKSDYVVQIISNTSLRVDDLLGLIGMVFIQGATLPVVYLAVFEGGSLPPLIMVASVWVGLVFYTVRAFRNIKYEWVYFIGNCIGLTGNGTLIFLILF